MLLARNKQATIALGEPQTIIGQSNCKVHRELFFDQFGIDLATTKIKRIKAHRDPGKRNITLMAVFPDDSYGPLEREFEVDFPSWGWGLASHKLDRYNDGKIRLLNPNWIDTNKMRRWKEECDTKHPPWCRYAYRVPSLKSVGPRWLIDCWLNCLVAARDTDRYIALSYVWGGVATYQTKKANLEELQKPGALISPSVAPKVPASIRHVIALTPLLRERYLWVDSLCIVQDDDTSKHHEIQKMAGIYANATLTIILRYKNADHGIPGLRGISNARDYTQKTFKLGRGYAMTQAIWGKQSYEYSVWSTRAWTFQEGLLSARRLTFQDQTAQWDCYCGGRQFEDFNSVSSDLGYAVERGYRDALRERFPDMCGLGDMVNAYNTRALSYPEDAHDAFSGLLSSMNASFADGFIFGLPLMNLDMGLLWEPSQTVTKRLDRNTTELSLPSWSWVGWEGEISEWPWYKANDYVKRTPQGRALQGAHLSERIIPCVQWYVYEMESLGKLGRIPVVNLWLGYREKYLIQESNDDLPEGWSRLEYVWNPRDFNGNYYRPDHGVCMRWYYKHKSSPEDEFWYPVPVSSDRSSFVKSKIYFPLISCQTECATLYGGEQISEYSESTIALRDSNGKWAGCLQLHEPLEATAATTSTNKDEGENETFYGPRNHHMVGFAFELARISIGYNFEDLELSNGLAEWKCAERPRCSDTAYVYYNVLWIVWENEVAFRQGIGRVARTMWDEQCARTIELVLG